MLTIRLTKREKNHLEDLIELRLQAIQERFGVKKIPKTIMFENALLRKLERFSKS